MPKSRQFLLTSFSRVLCSARSAGVEHDEPTGPIERQQDAAVLGDRVSQ
ncbi:MAG: hypothetical protein M1434_08130 [Chloroflexi bacterium]|nr:hypothetical protein [Chloroflexota bacterium]MCL5274698.1 hypothetical protein [Chloroflexota bacterium]